MIEIEGTIEEIIYMNEFNGYSVCGIRSGKETVVAVGCMPFINVGETVKLAGKWVTHPEYGQQLKVELYEKLLPQTEDAIEKYLSSGILKGVGPVTAARIVEKFGKETLDVLSFKPQLLSGIRGISLDKALRIGQAFEEQRGLRNVMMFLQGFGITPACCVRIYREFGDKAVERVKENPYCLSEEVFGIGFRTADRIAMSMGVDPQSKFRVSSGIKYILSEASANGHTFLPAQRLKELVSELLQAELKDIEDAVISLVMDKSIVPEKKDGVERIYLSPYYNAELAVCRRLMELAEAHTDTLPRDFDKYLDEVQQEDGITLADMQRAAVIEAATRGILVITGGPGTGKTTIIKCIIRILAKEGLRIELAAPTGRAAKRMTEATGYEARTIHRLLEAGYSGDEKELFFQRNEANPVEADVVIIDEMSMVDILLMNHLLKAVRPGVRLILVGDADQLPSVGAGNVLEDIIRCGYVKAVRLTDIFRQAQESMIIVNAHRIRSGEKPFLNLKDKDFFLVPRGSVDATVRTVVDLCARRLPETYSYDPMRQIQVLSPTRKGPAGVMNLNKELQSVLNPAKKGKGEKPSRDYIFREGDRVMQIRNNYNIRWEKVGQRNVDGIGVFNGDVGIISKIDDEEQKIVVLYDDEKSVEYEYGTLDELEQAFAVTIHKSQGSEFPVVVMPVFDGPPVLMTRNLLYTAVTRAKDMVVLVGDEEYLRKMVENVREIQRFTGLADKLKDYSRFADKI